MENTNDTLLGTTGADTLAGGMGDDVYIVDNVGDLIVENIDEGNDTVYSSIPYYTVSSYVENIVLSGTGNLQIVANYQDNLIYCNSGNNAVNGNPGNDTIYGYAGNDTLFACYGDDLVYGGTGNDSLIGAPGNDTLYGEAGVDTLDGRGENDTYYIDSTYDLVIEYSGKGTDTVLAEVNYTLTTNVENLTLTGTSAINGTGNELDNIITGNSSANVLSGLAGNDTLDGGIGIDTMTGSVGNDTYIIDNSKDVIIENENEGTDTVISSITCTLGGNQENLILNGTYSINGTGNTLDNTLIGNSAINTLSGLAGNDTYVIDTGSNKDIISDSAGEDKILFGSNVSESDVAFFQTRSSLNIDHGNTVNIDQITVRGQGSVKPTTLIERFELSNGKYLTSLEVNSIISYIAAYDKKHTELTITNVNDVKNNTDLMVYISNQWHT